MKGKFRFHYKDGSTMIDKNGFKTMSEASIWVKNHNSSAVTKRMGLEIVKITTINERKTKRKSTRKMTSGFLGAGLRMPKFRL